MNTIDALPLLARLKRKADTHKGDYGRILIIGGAEGMVGAPLLAGQAALYSGAGWVILGMLSPYAPAVMPTQPEIMVRPATKINLAQLKPDVIAIGPGLGDSEIAKGLLNEVLRLEIPLVIDADALNLIATDDTFLSRLHARTAPTVLTPHPGEAGRLLGLTSQAIQENRTAAIHALVKQTSAICILKGSGSLVTAPGHAVELCTAGNPGMAAAGMGDVLTGIIAALIGQGLRQSLDAWDATRCAVLLHAMAADSLVGKGIGPIGLTALEVAHEVRLLINQTIGQAQL